SRRPEESPSCEAGDSINGSAGVGSPAVTGLQAIVLALVQAVTEFLPISSSGHLILLPRLLGWSDQGLEFDIATNTGTLLAVLAYFRSDVAALLRGFVASLRRGSEAPADPQSRLAWALIWGTVPAG